MLSPMSMGSDDTRDVLKDELTDGAIGSLYDIVGRAQASTQATHSLNASNLSRNQDRRDTSNEPSSPSGALFRAYEEVLAEQGLHPSDDTILHRFLFHMQEDRRQDEGLLQRFHRVLGEMNIVVEEENENGVELTSNVQNPRDVMRNGAVAALGRHSRRGSFDSFFDGTADKVAGMDYGDLPLRTRRGSDDGQSGRPLKQRASSDTGIHLYQQARLPIRSLANGHGRRPSVSAQQRASRQRNASVSSHGSLQIWRGGRTGTAQISDYGEDDSDLTDRTTSLDLSHVQVPGINAPIPQQHQRYSSQQHQQYVQEPYRPSDTRLLEDAETFEMQRLHKLTRDCIQTWRSRTQEQLSIRRDMHQMATAFDRKILLKSSFAVILDTARVRRSGRETNLFFQRLELRADKARNMFLIMKAFTHWAKSAEDEVQRTSVARRHILRSKFFNGWREITVVNELKIQHFALAKFLQVWRARTAKVREKNDFSVAVYEYKLVKRVFRDWFFKFCNIGAPAWRRDRLKRTALQKISDIAKVLRERQAWATDRYETTSTRKRLQGWVHRIATVKEQQKQAASFRRNKLLSQALHALRQQAQLAPRLRLYDEQGDTRLVRSTIRTWQYTTQLSRQARNVDQMRIMRNAWTAWNDRLRVRALAERVDDRVIVECLYKWTLASRVSLFQRVHDRQLKKSTFLIWVTQANQRNNTLENAERSFARFKRTQLLQSCLRKMEAITAEKRREEFAVVANYQQNLKQRIFDKLRERHEHFQQFKTWSGHARFYVLSKRTLKVWNEATQHARRNRRRDMYTQFRRSIKTNLVRKFFENWKDKAEHISHINQQADELMEDRTMQTISSVVHQWHDRALIIRQQESQAANIYAFKIGSRHLRTWSDRGRFLHTMDSQASALRQESAELAASSAFKKLGWRLWNIQRQEENARALYERNFEKHVRAMIRFWADQMNEKMARGFTSPTPLSRSRRGDGDSGDRGHEGGREEEHEFDAGHDRTLEAFTALDAQQLGLDDELDLSLSMTPDRQRDVDPSQPPPSSTRAPGQRLQYSFLRPTPARPNTYPQPRSILRHPPQSIPEDSILDPAFATALDRDLADASTFWSGTPMHPPPTTSKTIGKAGYLKTPSKRSIVRAKRPELPTSPEKKARMASPVRRNLGAMSAPPAHLNRDVGLGGVTSFERRLREGGFGDARAGAFSASVAGPSSVTSRVRGKGKGRVGFGQVSQMG